ncbi:hypothetical protein D3C87_1603490 [compost metagenome]
MIDWVCNTCIFSDAAICIIYFIGSFKEFDILHQGTRTNSIIDLWLFFCAQVDCFCITTTFEIEYRTISPAMLIVTDQRTVRICTQGSFAGTA